jgi:hypothetical protein
MMLAAAAQSLPDLGVLANSARLLRTPRYSSAASIDGHIADHNAVPMQASGPRGY